MGNRKPAEDGVAEGMSAPLTGGGHHPPHAERGAELFRVPAPVRPGADHFLQRDHIGFDRTKHGRSPLRTDAAVDAAATMDVVGRDPDRRPYMSHYVMIDRVFVRAALAAAVLALASSACGSRPAEPITLEGRLLTIDNRTSREWKDVEVWLNRSYRVTTASIPPGGRFQAPVDVFVAGFGQRFDFRRAQINDVRVTAKLPDGKPLEITKPFEGSRLADALGGALGKKP